MLYSWFVYLYFQIETVIIYNQRFHFYKLQEQFKGKYCQIISNIKAGHYSTDTSSMFVAVR